MTKELLNPHKNSTAPGRSPVSARTLQRKCTCGGSSKTNGECEECKQKKLQRKAAATAKPAIPPPIVQDVLHSPGQPLDHGTRNFFEPRFGHDFSKVRVHTDERAAQSAHAVDALAYTVGQRVVFGTDQFSPHSLAGRKLLAHELAHVVQQGAGPMVETPGTITDPNDRSEIEADRLSTNVLSGLPHSPATQRAGARLMRKLKVLNAAKPIPDPSGKGLKQTNAETVESYLATMAQGSGVTVDRSSGEVSVSTAYCPGFGAGFRAGAKKGFGIFKGIPVLNVLLGGPAALIGGLIGGFKSLAGDQTSPAASSKTPTGSTCLCDILDSSQPWKIEINDEFPDKDHPHPVTLSQKIVTISPNNPKIVGAATVGGKLENDEPWLLLAHELCGHAWLEVKGKPETKDPVAHAYRDDTGQMVVTDPITKDSPGPHGHEFAVERENLIRKEHGLDPRGWRLKDPYCGESFLRDKSAPEGSPEFFPNKGYPGFNNLLEQCDYLRSQLPESKNKKFRIDEAIP